MRPRGAEFGVEFGCLDDRQHLALFDMIADVHQPLRDVAVDARINRGFVPCRGLPGQHQILADRGGLGGDDVHRRRRRVGGFRLPFLSVCASTKRITITTQKAKQQDAGRDTRADFQGRCRCPDRIRWTPPASVREVSSGNSAGRELCEFGSCGCIGSTYYIRISDRQPADGAATGTSWARKSESRTLRTTSRR